MKKALAAIILAAGKGERMKSRIPKVLHTICGRPMIEYVLDLVKSLKINKVIAVLGDRHIEVNRYLMPGIKVVIQKKLVGTADAVRVGLTALKNFKGTLLVLYADNPLLKKETVEKLIDSHLKNNADITLLTAKMDKPKDYGRILRDKYSGICGVVEEKDADDFQKDIKEINLGIACFNKEKLESVLRKVRPNNRKKEYYLTDVVGLLYKQDAVIESVALDDIKEGLGINSRQELAEANRIMQLRLNEEFMRQGVTIIDPASTFISFGARIGRDTVIYPFTVIEKDVRIGKFCFIGPFVHLRDNTRIADAVTIGNFVEVTRSKLASQSIVKHFGYLGDSLIGHSVNIGAGTVTANFDGKKKQVTVVKDRAFIGSDTVLVAPVKIGRGAQTGAGAVVVKNKDVPDGATVVGVPAQLLKKRERDR